MNRNEFPYQVLTVQTGALKCERKTIYVQRRPERENGKNFR
jgi:hypothetical protein